MTTVTRIKKVKAVKNIKNKMNWRAFFGKALQKISDSTGDMIVTVAVTGASLAYMQIVVHPMLLQIISGYYIAGMITFLFIRIVHRFDDHYTVDELAQRLMEIEYNTSEKLDAIIRNQ